MNAAFEDCTVLDALLEDAAADWARVFARFEALRRPNTEAIAQMALENYTEMRDTVRDAAFLRRQAIAMALERRFPDRFIPRYSMVMFHPEIPYAEALRRGSIQARLLEELDSGGGREPDAERAARLVTRAPAAPDLIRPRPRSTQPARAAAALRRSSVTKVTA